VTSSGSPITSPPSNPPGDVSEFAAKKALLYGYPDQVHVKYKNRYGRERSYYTNYEGAIPDDARTV